jgi:hypothetical protein
MTMARVGEIASMAFHERRAEDVIAKLDAIREQIAGGKCVGENSTDVIREAREARDRRT